MKNYLFIFCFIFCLKIHGQTNVSSQDKIVSLDTTKIAILSSDIILKYIFNKNCIESNLSNEEVINVDLLLRKCIDNYNIEAEKEFRQITVNNPSFNPNRENFIIDIEKYKRQYVVVKNSKGEKEVWINCLCSERKNWRRELIVVRDGGNCYFNLKINLTKKKYYELGVNEDA
jgi:hypothetical protein